MILVDLSSILFSAYHALPKLDEGMFRHLVLNSLRTYNLKNREKYGQMVICCDGTKYWRKDRFPQYKASRKTARENDDVDWTEVFRVMDVVKSEIREFLPWKTITVERAECDDIIATLVETTQGFGEHDDVLIISADGDFAQLQKYSNVKQFSPMAGKQVVDKNPGQSLREKIIRGDAGDGIPNVFSADDCFVTKTRQTRASAKKLKHILDNWNTVKEAVDDITYARLQRNASLIDFSHIPSDLAEEIRTKYNETVPPPRSGVFNYLIMKRLTQLVSSAGDFFPKN